MQKNAQLLTAHKFLHLLLQVQIQKSHLHQDQLNSH